MTKHTTPEYRNWVSFAHGLINVFCKRLRPFVTRETENFYSKVSAAVAACPGGPCTCTFAPRRRPNQYHDMRTCTWANFLQGHHHRNIPNWKQSDSTKWTDPIQGPWEIAKLFLPDLGGHTVTSAEDMDLTGILNLMYWCDHFRPIPQPLIKDLRDIRNRVWGHVTKLELTNAEKATAFGAIEALLQHPSLAHDLDAQKALHEIQLLKTVTDVDNFQAQVLKQFKEMIEEDILGLKSDSTQNREDLQQLEERLRIVENLEIVRNTNQRAGHTLESFVKNGALLLCDNLILCTQRISECMLTPWLVMILLCNFSVTLLDPISYMEGCPLEVGAVPFDTKEFNFTSHLNKARESFTGRIWLSHLLESLLTGSQGNNFGEVLIAGAPGTGKSAFSAQLICSSAFNPYINRRIIGYHLCRHSDVATQEPGRFVRNLVNLIARRIPEYGMLIHNSPFILRILQRSCLRDPYHCFEEAIASPLKRVSNDFQSYFIIIDALDECSSEAGGTSLVQFIKDTYNSLPKCVHLVMTSRNDPAVLKHFSNIPKVHLSSEDVRNLQDVEIFIATKLLEDTAFLERLKVMLSFVKGDAVSYLVNRLLNQSEGNFLFAKLMLLYGKENWSNKSDLNKLPATINDQCESYFRRAFGSREKFKPALPVLEILAATVKPLKLNHIFDVLRFRQKIDFEYDFVYTLQGLYNNNNNNL